MMQDTFEVRTPENIKIGDIVVYKGQLAVCAKHGKHYGYLSIEEIVGQIVGCGIDFQITLIGDIDRRIEIVQTRQEILIPYDY